MFNENYNELSLTIVTTAIEDYKLLKRYNAERLVVDDLTITKEEIEEFFYSDWCDWILEHMHLSGRDILRWLNRE